MIYFQISLNTGVCHVPNDLDEVFCSAWPLPCSVMLTQYSCSRLLSLSVSVSVSASSSDDFQLGSKVTLQCKVKGLNSVPAVQWLRPDGSPHTGSEMVLKSESDSGIWKCTFSYEGETYSENLDIQVKGGTLPSTKVFAFVFYHNNSKPLWMQLKIKCYVFGFREKTNNNCINSLSCYKEQG